MVIVVLPVSAPAASAADPCSPVVSVIACENSKPGTPQSTWDISGSGDSTIQGFATDISVNVGGTVNFKIKTNASAYTIDIYRTGWYGGDGARLIASILPSATLPQTQPACLTDSTTLLYDCGNWAVSASWAVPSNAVSGVYIADLTRTDTGGMSQIIFIVRNDASHSAILLQTSDTTWQAYNTYGGSSLYPGPNGQGKKVSYNRPFITRGGPGGRDFYFGEEYPLVRFLERNGYDVSYTTGVDTDRRGNLITNHKVFISSGHDEYWSGQQRANVEAARAAGVNLVFMSGNEIYWKTRWETSTDGSGTPYRTLVTYKETQANAKIDPSPEWTGTWRDPRFSPPSDGGRPENALSGTAYMSNTGGFAIQVPAAEGKMRLWRNTSVATLPTGGVATLAPETLGYEFDEDLDNGFRPAGLVRLSTTTESVPQYLQDYGSTVAPGVATHHMTLYRASSGALVFSTGTIQWSWGLDPVHDGTSYAADPRMQQATVNILADMGTQPATLMAGMVAASASTDTQAPSSTITAPANGTVVNGSTPVVVTGTAVDAGGGTVGGVEVSVDGGTTWHPATGLGSWSYQFIPAGTGTINVKVRAVDDSGNLETPGPGITLTSACPCNIFGGQSPQLPIWQDAGDPASVELGVRFSSSVSGFVTGVRFYKGGAANGGTHTGSLWSSSGSLLATATFTGESASGWQTVLFSSPVAVTAGTTYVASYLAPQGHYSSQESFFTSPYTASPLTATGGGLPVRVGWGDALQHVQQRELLGRRALHDVRRIRRRRVWCRRCRGWVRRGCRVVGGVGDVV